MAKVMARDIMTIPDLRKAINDCYIVLAQLRFGNNEHEVKISKTEAKAFVDAYPNDTTVEHAEMYAGRFGYLDQKNCLHLG
jgi:hypothetical protein